MKKTSFVAVCLLVYSFSLFGQENVDSLFEDIKFKNEGNGFFRSENIDFIRVKSTITEDVEFAVVFINRKTGPIVLISHGWHQSVMPPERTSKIPTPNFLRYR